MLNGAFYRTNTYSPCRIWSNISGNHVYRSRRGIGISLGRCSNGYMLYSTFSILSNSGRCRSSSIFQKAKKIANSKSVEIATGHNFGYRETFKQKDIWKKILLTGVWLNYSRMQSTGKYPELYKLKKEQRSKINNNILSKSKTVGHPN